MDNLKIGKQAELSACKFLQNQGLQFCQSNYHAKTGEIDLIMKEGNEIVFVEVRMRNNLGFGSGVESVNFYKQKKIINTALHYLNRYQLMDKVNCRFDVVGISFVKNQIQFEWIQDAFLANF